MINETQLTGYISEYNTDIVICILTDEDNNQFAIEIKRELFNFELEEDMEIVIDIIEEINTSNSLRKSTQTIYKKFNE